MDFTGILEKLYSLLNFIYDLNINEKIETAFRIYDLLFYFSVFRIIILIPLFIILGVIIFIIFFKGAAQTSKNSFAFGYVLFLILLVGGVGIDIMILVLGVYYICSFNLSIHNFSI